MKKCKTWINPRLCYLYFTGFYPGCTILTLRLEGEEEEDVGRFLEQALDTLPFETMGVTVQFAPWPESRELMDHIEIKEVQDYPGAARISLVLGLEIESGLSFSN